MRPRSRYLVPILQTNISPLHRSLQKFSSSTRGPSFLKISVFVSSLSLTLLNLTLEGQWREQDYGSKQTVWTTATDQDNNKREPKIKATRSAHPRGTPRLLNPGVHQSQGWRFQTPGMPRLLNPGVQGWRFYTADGFISRYPVQLYFCGFLLLFLCFIIFVCLYMSMNEY